MDSSTRATRLVAALARAARVPVSEALLLALAFLVKNRLARFSAEALEARLPVTAGAPAGRALRAAAMAALAEAYAGARADPTRGATELHRHDEAPLWAAALTATALIGPYLFLARADTAGGGTPAVRAPVPAPRAAASAIHP
jgi:hypothetical protein